MAALLLPGEPAPWFQAAALAGSQQYTFDTVAGRWVVMLLMGTGAPEASQDALRLVEANRDLFDDNNACFFGVTADPRDAEQGRIAQQLPGIRWFLDYDRQVSASYRAIVGEGEKAGYLPHWLLLDPMLRVCSRALLKDGEAIMAELRRRLGTPIEVSTAPVLVVRDILPPELCRRLIDLYEEHPGEESGFMRQENGVTVAKIDHSHKRRSDYTISDDRLIATLGQRLSTALRPMIRRAFQFEATRIERWIVACYDAAEGGHFRAHRDNTTKGTAHRKFAVTINLNAEDYDCGDLVFPEFGPKTYRAPTGGAVVFSCSLLHTARPVTRGKRYAFLPFLYDEEGALTRERNLAFVSTELQGYRSGLSEQASS